MASSPSHVFESRIMDSFQSSLKRALRIRQGHAGNLKIGLSSRGRLALATRGCWKD